MKKREYKWYEICSVCNKKIKYNEDGYPVYYVNERPVYPFEWDDMDPITVFCSAKCSLEHHERNKK
jgi:hypothetical protein